MKSDLMANSRRNDPESSKRAAELMEETDIRAQQTRAVLSMALQRPGSTAAEIADWLQIERHIPSRRLPDLRKAGKLVNGYGTTEQEIKDDTRRRMRTCKVVNKLSLTWWPKERDEQGDLFK